MKFKRGLCSSLLSLGEAGGHPGTGTKAEVRLQLPLQRTPSRNPLDLRGLSWGLRGLRAQRLPCPCRGSPRISQLLDFLALGTSYPRRIQRIQGNFKHIFFFFCHYHLAFNDRFNRKISYITPLKVRKLGNFEIILPF